MIDVKEITKWFYSKEQLATYFRNARIAAYENKKEISDLEVQKVRKHNKLVRAMLKISLLINGQKRIILGDKHTVNGKPKIFACTHIGRWDAEHCLLAIDDYAHVFFGDPGGIYRTINGLLLSVNGVVYCETDNKLDRMAAKAASIDILNHGGNLLIYPEGAWNITENEPVMFLYSGATDMAIETGAEIIPIAMECYGNMYEINIGANIVYDKNFCYETEEERRKLRDILATLRWEIWERHGIYKRADLDTLAAQKYLEYVMRGADDNDYTVEKIQERRFSLEHKWE